MTPSEGQRVKVYFRAGIQTEGIVKSWSPNISTLMSGGNLLVINKTLDDVMFYIIQSQSKEINIKEETEKLEQEFKTNAEIINKKPTDITKLAALKAELNRMEKEEIANKMKSHTTKEIKPAEYTLPSFLTKK